MSLPATDNFNRADANPIGGNWTTVPGQAAVQILSSVATDVGGAVSAAYWNADTPSNDHYSQVAAGAVPFGPMVRMNTAQLDGYLLYCNGSPNATIYRMDNGSANATVASLSFTYAAGDILKLEAVGTALTAYKNGVSQGGGTSGTYTSGSVGIYIGNGGTLDDWEGGNVGGAAPDFTFIKPWMIA